MSAAATRDDLLSVVTALRGEAALQESIRLRYEERATAAVALDPPDRIGEMMWRGFGYEARGMRVAYEISANMISKYVDVK